MFVEFCLTTWVYKLNFMWSNCRPDSYGKHDSFWWLVCWVVVFATFYFCLSGSVFLFCFEKFGCVCVVSVFPCLIECIVPSFWLWCMFKTTVIALSLNLPLLFYNGSNLYLTILYSNLFHLFLFVCSQCSGKSLDFGAFSVIMKN